MISSRTILKLMVCSSLTMVMGCASFWYDLQPHRMQRWNRGPAPSIDPEFSLRETDRLLPVAARKKSSKSATITANSADVSAVRAQSPE